jgi:hypothetical protein
MKLQKRKFYIIGHNPNTIDEAKAFLDAGANALEPDICFDVDEPDQYYVSHGGPGSNDMIPEHSLVKYLTDLRHLITGVTGASPYNLALINFDIKTADEPGFEINKFIDVVFDNFSSFPICNGVAILITVGSLTQIAFLNAYDQMRSFVGIGIDEEKVPKDVQAGFKADAQKRFCYANGIITTGIKLGVFKTIIMAKGLQAQGNGDSFKLIYTWVLADPWAMRSYLDLHIDAMIVNIERVQQLKNILLEKPYLPIYELAKNGYDPFGAPPIPEYLLTIKTRDVHLAGTDEKVKYTLVGSAGVLDSTLDGSYKDVMAAGETDFITLEGGNIGKIQSLQVAVMDSSIDSDWLPEFIKLESNMIPHPVTFNFGQHEWVQFQHPITKTP